MPQCALHNKRGLSAGRVAVPVGATSCSGGQEPWAEVPGDQSESRRVKDKGGEL